MSVRLVGFPLVALTLLVGCSSHDGHSRWSDTSISDGALVVRGDQAVLKPDGAAEATIDAKGELHIGGQAVTVNDAQRALLRRYYAAAAAVRTHGIETGKAGAKVAGVALEGAASSLLHGDGDAMEKKIDSQAQAVEQSAGKICNDLVDIRTAQDALATQLPAFQPYAKLVTEKSVDDCRDDKVVHRS